MPDTFPELPTPFEAAPAALAQGRRLYLKREEVHELGAFKWRAAIRVIDQYRDRGHDTVVTASTGNHGAATAWAAARRGMRAIVFVPPPPVATQAKLDLIAGLGAELRITGTDFDEAKQDGVAFAAERGLPFFEDGAERAQFEGYRAIAAEILEQRGSPPGTILVPVGNGALICGIGLELMHAGVDTDCVGVAAKDAPCMYESWREGRPIALEECGTFAAGLAVRVAVPLAVEVMREVVTDLTVVSERAIAGGIAAFAAAGIRVEGAPAAALAAFHSLPELREPVVLVVTGRNIDDAEFERALRAPASFPE